MKQSRLFTKTLKENPAGEISVNAQLLERAGFVYKNSAGIYSFLPLGWKVLEKIAKIIREEMNAIGGQEMFMAALVEKRYLDATNRWEVEVGFEVKGKKEKTAGFVLGWTHEEVLTEIATKYINSYKDLPFYAYQIQTKFRNEPRAKSGLLRGREFMMKDLYSFHTSKEDLDRYYKVVAQAYEKIFDRCGLKAIYTLAAGGDFTISNTHEFQVISPVGEDAIFVCQNSQCGYAINQEVTQISKLKEDDFCPKQCGGKMKKENAIEVGNIFPLGDKYSKAFNLKFVDEKGEFHYVIMGSYGIGLGRVMGTVVEIYHDEKGIIWPESVAPFKIHLLALKGAEKEADEIYEDLLKAEVEVLYDDRELSAGIKFADADLVGIPYRVVVSEKTLREGSVEIKKRVEERTQQTKIKELVVFIK